MTTTTTPHRGRKETAMPPFTTTVTPIDAGPDPWGSGAYRIDCTCGESHVYAGREFTTVEARRHVDWHAKAAA